MNIILSGDKKDSTFDATGFIIISSFLSLLILIGLFILFTGKDSTKVSNKDVVVVNTTIDNPFFVIDDVATSYGVPVGPMERFAIYLRDNKFNELYGGVGLFSVRPSHLQWIKDNVLKDTTTDLKDDLQNTQVAAFLLKRFHDSGYSWVECFLIYSYGFPAIHQTSKYQDFIKAVFPNGE